MVKRVSLKGKGAELFFGGLEPAAPPGEAITSADTPAPPRASDPSANGDARPAGGSAKRRERGARASDAASTRASTLASGDDAELVETVRRVVKSLGKEVSFVRVTPAEKDELGEVIYAFKQRGVKTTENEINRIAINVLLADHRANGDGSLLARVLAALRA